MVLAVKCTKLKYSVYTYNIIHQKIYIYSAFYFVHSFLVICLRSVCYEKAYFKALVEEILVTSQTVHTTAKIKQ